MEDAIYEDYMVQLYKAILNHVWKTPWKKPSLADIQFAVLMAENIPFTVKTAFLDAVLPDYSEE